MSSEQLQLPPIDLSSYEQLILVAVAVLVQALDLVESSLNDDAQLSFPSTLIPGSTIGKHLRHARDHFTLLLDGLSRGRPLRVSYDTRIRDTPMETSRTAASNALKETIERLRSLKVDDIDEELILDAITPYTQILKTSVGRECLYIVGFVVVLSSDACSLRFDAEPISMYMIGRNLDPYYNMPELAEVEHAANVIRSVAKGRKIHKVSTTEDTIVYTGTSHTEFAEQLTGKTLIDTGRYGKVFYLLLDGEKSAVLHLGMTGAIHVRGQEGLYYRRKPKQNKEEWPPRFMKFILHFESSGADSTPVEIAFVDARRLGRIRLCNDPLKEPPISNLGFDPILCMPDLEEFESKVLKRGCPIKALLLDQSFSAGVGNWIADEVLYHSAIHPEQVCKTLSSAQIKALHHNIVYVCQTAVDVNADASRFPSHWLFPHRWGKGKNKSTMTLPSGQKASIKWVTVGGRTSAVVQQVQKLVGSSKQSRKRSKAEETPSESSLSAHEGSSALSDNHSDSDDDSVKKPVVKRKRNETKPEQARKKLKRSGLTQLAEELTLTK
ncbi:hypothetical protein FRC17_005454 [Serendipita sp. 399]|nr:hypothetical protein FRC17_005454 [Serendipita sp. 399]